MVLPAGGGRRRAALRALIINTSGQLFQGRLRGDDVSLEYADKLRSPSASWSVLPHAVWPTATTGWSASSRPRHRRAPSRPRAPPSWAGRPRSGPCTGTRSTTLKEALRKRSVWFLNEVTSFAAPSAALRWPAACYRVMGPAPSTTPTSTSGAGPLASSSRDEGGHARRLGKTGHRVRLSPHEGTPERLAGLIGPGHYLETIEKYRTNGYSIEAALALIGTYHYLLATHAWPAPVAEALKAGLLASSGKSWREAAALLMEHAGTMIEDDEPDAAEDGGEAEEAQ
jgi:hypothetical protein